MPCLPPVSFYEFHFGILSVTLPKVMRIVNIRLFCQSMYIGYVA